MSEVFPVNRGLRPIYLLMASAHRYAIDYVEQAPVIVLAATRGNAHTTSMQIMVRRPMRSHYDFERA